MRMILLAVFVAGCTGGSGDDIDCAFNEGLVRSTDVDNMNAYQTTATAVGGTQKFAAVYRNCGVESPLDLRIATLQNPALATVKVLDGVAVVTGVAEGTTNLDVKDTSHSAEVQVSVATIANVALASHSVAAGTAFVQILLVDRDLNAVVDDSLTVSGALALGDRWDHLAIGNIAPGDYAVTIHAGGTDWPVTITVQ